MAQENLTGIVVWSQETNLRQTIAWNDLTHTRTGHVELPSRAYEIGPPTVNEVWFHTDPFADSSTVWSLMPGDTGGVVATEVPHGRMIPLAVSSDSTRAIVCADVCWIGAVTAAGFGIEQRVEIEDSEVPRPAIRAWPHNGRIIVERYNELSYVNATSGRVSPGPKLDAPLETISLDGNMFAWVKLRNSTEGVVYWRDVDRTEIKSVTIPGAQVDCLFVSSVAVLACVAVEAGLDAAPARLYIIDPHTAAVRELARDLARNGTYGVVGSPDGRFLAVPVQTTGGGNQLVAIEIGTGRRTPLSPVVERVYGSGWMAR